MQGCGKFLQEVLSHCLMCCAVSLMAQIHKFRNQGLEIRVAPSTIILSDPLLKLLLPDLATLHSVDLKVWVPKGRALPPGDPTIPLNWKFRLPPSYVRVLVPLNQQRRELCWQVELFLTTMEIRLIPHNEAKEEHV